MPFDLHRAASTHPTTDAPAYFEHVADVGVIGRGPTLEAAFEAAARATFALMAEPQRVRRDLTVEVAFEEDDVEFALVQWLNALLAAAHEQRAVFAEFRLARDGAHWRGRATGARWQPADDRGTEVKGATLTSLSVRETAQGWEARCVVDV